MIANMAAGKREIRLLLLLLLLGALAGCAREQDPAATPEPGPPRDTAVALASRPASTHAPPTAAAGFSEAGQGLVPTLPTAPPLPEASPVPQVYVVAVGDTLSDIARRFGCDLQALVKANGITNPNALQVGQRLTIPAAEVAEVPVAILLPNSEFVYGPAYAEFDTVGFVQDQGGYLAGYVENVGGETLTGPEIVTLIAHHYGVGPRLLLAIMELRSGWVTKPAGRALPLPMGYNGSGWELLSQQLAWAAGELSRGYYDWRGRGMAPIAWGDGSVTQYPPGLNAATAGLHRFFSLDASRDTWQVLVGDGSGSFLATYRDLFGDPSRYAVEPLVPADLADPGLVLPWAKGETWWYTGGPHGAWNEDNAWAAVDFVPDEGYLGCQVADSWATAAADGLIVYSHSGEVMLDLDGDGHEQTGWVLFYLHVATEGRVPAGTRVEQGDPIGHPSCEGGFSESSHLHFARRYNGEWIAADGPLPMSLSGWQFYSAGRAYDGTARRGSEEREACECRDVPTNGLLNDR